MGEGSEDSGIRTWSVTRLQFMAQVSRTTKIAAALIAVAAAAVIALQVVGPQRTMAQIGEVMHAPFGQIGPAPWPDGSSFSVDPYWASLRKRCLPELSRCVGLQWLSRYVSSDSGWAVLNMHNENLHELCRLRGFRWVKVEKVAERGRSVACLVVDKRVPREWLLETPRGCPFPMRQKLRAERPECFREDPRTRALIGTTWVLVDRDDPEDSLGRWFPGDRIHFNAFELSCETAAGLILERRSWEPNSFYTRFSLGVYEVHGDSFTGMVFEVSRSGDTMTLIPRSTVEHDDRGTRGSYLERQESPLRVRYRLVNANSN